MSFNALSLLELSEAAVLGTYVVDFEKLAGILPKTVYTALFQKWLSCPEDLNVSDDENDRVYDILKNTDIFEASGDDIPSHLVRRCVIALTEEKYNNYETFPYIGENYYNHLKIECVIERKVLGGERNLCNKCFEADSHYSLPFCGNIWDHERKYYLRMFDHAEVYGNEVFTKYMKDKFYWCSSCNITPLFKIVDADECVMQYHNHYEYYSPLNYEPEDFFFVSSINGKYNYKMFEDFGHLF